MFLNCSIYIFIDYTEDNTVLELLSDSSTMSFNELKAIAFKVMSGDLLLKVNSKFSSSTYRIYIFYASQFCEDDM